MRRREFLGMLGGMTAACSLTARAQEVGAVPVIGFLNSGASGDPFFTKLASAFREGLKTIGYVENQNVQIDFRWAEGQYDRLPTLAAELVQRQVSVISAGGPPAAKAAKAATATIPIIFTVGDDPVKLGLVASFNRPGGNATGVNLVLNETEGKRLGLLRELLPSGTIVAVILNATNPAFETQSKDVEAAARAVGQQIRVVTANSKTEIDAALDKVVQEKAGGLLVGSDQLFAVNRQRFIDFAARQALPAAYDTADQDQGGGLISYGISVPNAYFQAGIYVGRVLKGETPNALPVVRSDKFELIINLKTAKTLGISIPSGVISIADRVIE